MKIQCEGCSALVEPAVNPTARGVELTCPECGHVGLLGGAAPAAAPGPALDPPTAQGVLQAAQAARPGASPVVSLDPVAVAQRGVKVEAGEGDVRCPKCGYRQRDPVACHRCGLVFELAGERTWEAVPEGAEAAVEEMEQRWTTLVAGEGMRDREAHRTFTVWARQRGLLEHAARRYRFFAQDHPGTPEAEVAAEALTRIIELMHAEFVLREGAASQGESFESRVKGIHRALLVVAIVMCVGVLALALYIFVPFN